LISWAGQCDDWKSPWVNTTFADGSRCRDGNPIFSAVSSERRLGVRVIQQEFSDDPRELSFWTDTFGNGDSHAVRELVVSCVLTQVTLNNVFDLLSQWITSEEVETRQSGYYETSTGRSPSRGDLPKFPPASRRQCARRLEMAGAY
jgi:hypothetical protein